MKVTDFQPGKKYRLPWWGKDRWVIANEMVMRLFDENGRVEFMRVESDNWEEVIDENN